MLSAALLMPTAGSAVGLSTYTIGGNAKFPGTTGGTLKRGSGYSLILARKDKKTTLGSLVDPQSVEAVGLNEIVVADGAGKAIREYRRSGGAATWTYTSSDLKQPVHAVPVEFDTSGVRLSRPHYLITDREAGRVIEVDPANTNKPKVIKDGLSSPYSATRFSDGRTMIAEGGKHRVIEWDYKQKKVSWSYGFADASGTTSKKRLRTPRYAVRLSKERILIADSGNHFVFEVTSDKKTIPWSFGKEGTAGSDNSHLSRPSCVRKLPDGRYAIADTSNNRVLWVGSDGTYSDKAGGINDPRVFVADSNGVLVPADGAVSDVGYRTWGYLEIPRLDLKTPSVRKWLTSIALSSDQPIGTRISVEYAVDGSKTYRALPAALNFPTGTRAALISLRIEFKTNNASKTPQLKSATVNYSLTKPTYTSGTGTGAGNVGESAGTGTGSTTGIGLGTSLTSTTTAGSFPTTGTASLDGTATGTGFPPGSSSGGGNGVLTGNLLQKVQGPDPLGGQSGSDAGVDPNAPVKMEHDLYGMVLSWALVTAAFLTGVFSDALGSVGKAAYRATLAKIMQWREA